MHICQFFFFNLRPFPLQNTLYFITYHKKNWCILMEYLLNVPRTYHATLLILIEKQKLGGKASFLLTGHGKCWPWKFCVWLSDEPQTFFSVLFFGHNSQRCRRRCLSLLPGKKLPVFPAESHRYAHCVYSVHLFFFFLFFRPPQMFSWCVTHVESGDWIHPLK